jgi:hypothetical protein
MKYDGYDRVAHDVHPADLIEAQRAPLTFRTPQDVADARVEYWQARATAGQPGGRPVPRPIPDVKRALAALRHRHGLDRDTVAAMAFERSRQHNVPLTRAFTDLVAELDRIAENRDGTE